MMKRIKLLTLILMAVLALSLCSCSLLDSFRGTAAAELPDVSTPKTELTEAEAVALYDGIMSCSADGDSVPDYQSVAETVVAAKAFSTPATVAAYLDYVALCEASGFENGGSMSVTDGSCVTAFFTGNEEEVILVIHRNDTMYVIYLELDLPESEPPVWPTDEEFARYGASLTQAEGTTLVSTSHTTRETDPFIDCDTLFVMMDGASRGQYSDYVAAVAALGFVHEPHGDEWDGQVTHIAYKTVGKTAYGCEVRYVYFDSRSVLTVTFWNETQNIQRDSGILISDLWEKGTFVLRSEYLYAPDEGYYPDYTPKPDGTADKGEPSYEPYVRHDYMVLSFSERGYLEFWNSFESEVAIDRESVFKDFGSDIYDYENKIIYRIYNRGMNKLSEKDENKLNPGYKGDAPDDSAQRFFYSIERHVSSRATTIGGYYYSAQGLTPTGKRNVIAGIECAEYTGVCRAVDGDNVITWEATFNVWEEYNIALSYRGQRSFEDESEYYEEYVYLGRDSWLDYALDLPDYGTYSDRFPHEEIEREAGISLPALEGSCGFYIDYATRPDEEVGVLGPKEYNRYVFGEVSRAEFLAYRRALEEAGFTVYDEWTSPFIYRKADNVKVEMGMLHDPERDTLTIYFNFEKSKPVSLPPVGTYTVSYVDGGEERLIEYAVYTNGDIRANNALFVKTGKYTYRYGGIEINAVDLYGMLSSGYIIRYTDDWGYEKCGKDSINGIGVAVYQGESSRFKVWVHEESGFILKRIYEGEVTVSVVSYLAGEPTKP